MTRFNGRHVSNFNCSRKGRSCRFSPRPPKKDTFDLLPIFPAVPRGLQRRFGLAWCVCFRERGTYQPQQIFASIVLVFLLFFQCSPPSAMWSPLVRGKCDLQNAANNFGFFTTAWGSFTDVALALYPLTFIWNLRMKVTTKCGICIVLSLGFVAGIAAAINCYYIHVVEHTGDATMTLTPLTLLAL